MAIQLLNYDVGEPVIRNTLSNINSDWYRKRMSSKKKAIHIRMKIRETRHSLGLSRRHYTGEFIEDNTNTR